MANSNGWGDGSANNAIGWGQGANNAIGWGDIHAKSYAGATDIVGTVTPPTDPDAQAFITAASITDPTQQAAINQLVVDLKADSLWTKMKALYPFVGGTASQHKFNLKDPRDLDVAFRLQFIGGGTWGNNGYTPNGTNGYADTKFIPSSQYPNSTSKHLSFYLRTNNAPISADPVDMGSFNTGGGKDVLLSRNTTQTTILSDITVSNSQTDARGFSLGTRTSTTNNLFKNNTKVNTASGSGANAPFSIYVGALNLGGLYGLTNNQFAFASIGDGLNDTEAANFYTAVQAFQTSLNRNV
jgi:hypothetical protein